MTASLIDAAEATDQRLHALDDDPVGVSAGADQIRLMAVGFDLDVEEVQRATAMAALGFVRAVTTGRADMVQASRGLFFNGILTGLIFAEMRQREGVTVDAD